MKITPEGWPADADNEDLERLASELQSLPALPAESLARVRSRLDAELNRETDWQRRRRLAFGWSIAAAVLVALGGYAWFRFDDVPAPVVRQEAPAPRVEDRVLVAIGVPDATAGDGKPLVQLDDYRSLFTD